jgi:hypothetical protein
MEEDTDMPKDTFGTISILAIFGSAIVGIALIVPGVWVGDNTLVIFGTKMDGLSVAAVGFVLFGGGSLVYGIVDFMGHETVTESYGCLAIIVGVVALATGLWVLGII